MTRTKDYQTTEVLKRLIVNYVKPYRFQLYLAIFFMVLNALCGAGLVKLVQPAMDQVFLNKDRNMLMMVPLMMLGFSIGKGVAEYFQNYIIKYVGQRILSDLQIVLYKHLLKSDIAFIYSQSSARLISRFTNDITLMRGAVSNVLVGVAKHLLTVLFLIGIMFSLQPTISCIVFFVFPIAIYPIQKNGKKIRKLAYSAQEELGNYTAKLDETFQSITVVKSYRAECFESKMAKSYIDRIFELYKSTARYDALTSPIMEILSGLAIAFVIVYGGHLVIEGQTTPGALFAFITAFVSAYRPYKSLVTFNVNLQEGVAAANRLFKVLDQEPKIREDISAEKLNCKDATIEFKAVDLAFGEKKALNHMSLVIKPNSCIALVGRSGEGKTSIANLLLRFYDPTSGAIFINNQDIKHARLSSLRGQIALVTQDTHLFDATVAENIAYNMPKCTKAEIEKAAKAASAHDFIMNLPEGYQTIIGHQGRSLSGGQRQRLAIARAFLKDAPILILDEATSSLDPQTEQEIKNAIEVLCKNRTTIIITHRLSTIEHVDNIYVVKNGKIVENGAHKALLSSKGEYYKLYNKQHSGE